MRVVYEFYTMVYGFRLARKEVVRDGFGYGAERAVGGGGKVEAMEVCIEPDVPCAHLEDHAASGPARSSYILGIARQGVVSPRRESWRPRGELFHSEIHLFLNSTLPAAIATTLLTWSGVSKSLTRVIGRTRSLALPPSLARPQPRCPRCRRGLEPSGGGFGCGCRSNGS